MYSKKVKDSKIYIIKLFIFILLMAVIYPPEVYSLDGVDSPYIDVSDEYSISDNSDNTYISDSYSGSEPFKKNLIDYWLAALNLTGIDVENSFVAQIEAMDIQNSIIYVSVLGTADKNDTVFVLPDDRSVLSGGDIKAYNFADEFVIYKNNRIGTVDDLRTGDVVLFTSEDEVLVSARYLEFRDMEGNRVVTGIVEENNVYFGYITLYREDGWGTSPENSNLLSLTRTFRYSDLSDIEVFSNHKKVPVDEIESGDTVFIKLDPNGNITGISFVKNYTTKYGTLLRKGYNTITVEYDDGTQQILGINKDVKIFRSQVQVGFEALKDGDGIKLVLNINGRSTDVKEIYIEDDRFKITGIYKGTLSYIDTYTGKLIVRNMEVFENGDWRLVEQKGFSSIVISRDCQLFYKGLNIDATDADKYLRGFQTYIVVRRDFGGNEIAVVVSFKNNKEKEVLYDDTVLSASGWEITLGSTYTRMKISRDSIIVKDGRLVTPGSIEYDDRVYVVANRDNDTGEFVAGIVEVKDRNGLKQLRLFRGRITDIVTNRSVTLGSWSELDGFLWKYYNTPKTFEITYDTKIIGEKGIINSRNFVDFGQNNYRDASVYIVSRDDQALLISTAPYGVRYSRGEIYELVSSPGTGITGFTLKDSVNYDIEKLVWKDSGDISVNLLKNTIIIKNDEIIEPSDLKVGDKVGIIRKDDSLSGDAYIILVD